MAGPQVIHGYAAAEPLEHSPPLPPPHHHHPAAMEVPPGLPGTQLVHAYVVADAVEPPHPPPLPPPPLSHQPLPPSHMPPHAHPPPPYAAHYMDHPNGLYSHRANYSQATVVEYVEYAHAPPEYGHPPPEYSHPPPEYSHPPPAAPNGSTMANGGGVPMPRPAPPPAHPTALSAAHPAAHGSPHVAPSAPPRLSNGSASSGNGHASSNLDLLAKLSVCSPQAKERMAHGSAHGAHCKRSRNDEASGERNGAAEPMAADGDDPSAGGDEAPSIRASGGNGLGEMRRGHGAGGNGIAAASAPRGGTTVHTGSGGDVRSFTRTSASWSAPVAPRSAAGRGAARVSLSVPLSSASPPPSGRG